MSAALARDINAELILAATAGKPDEIAQLIHDGADPNAVNTEGTPALSLASLRTDRWGMETMNALLAHGANIDVPDKNGQSPLFYAARSGNVATTTFLLQHGAQVYLTDKTGNIARTVAYNAGQKEMVKVMDDFVTAETDTRMKAYAERNAQIAAGQQQLRAATKTAAQPQSAPAPAVAAPQRPAPPPPPPPLDEAKLKTLVHDLSFHACAAQYWLYLKEVKQIVPFTPEQLNGVIDAHTRLSQIAAKTMADEFHAPPAYAAHIAQPSRDQIMQQITPFPTNAHRKEEGIGKKEDAQQRCEEIADQWRLVDAGSAPAAPPRRAAPSQPAQQRFPPVPGAR
ncbi:MAG: ankyrin repeat domain-containing protein [Alphaproteobacteria bacterium]|nr:ankyrin repeat domain-containing protein [Alphaproteobacteria bacterium]